MKIGENTRMILVTFVVSKTKDIPKAIQAIGEQQEETVDGLNQRQNKHILGEVVIERTKNCSVATILTDLAQAGFEVAKVVCKRMLDGRWQVKIEFVPHGDIKNRGGYLPKARDQIEEAVITLCEDAFWAARVYLNSFFSNGKVDPKGKMLSIVFDGRTTLVMPNGGPVVEWQKDEFGRHVGNVPLPIKAKHRLVITDNTIKLVSV